jgi:hypothetical protein
MAHRDRSRMKPSRLHPISAETAQLDNAGTSSGHYSRHSRSGKPDVPVEPPVEPVPELLSLYRAHEPWLEGRLVITPHAAWLTPESEADTRRKSAETMRAALLTNRPQNVITPEMY